MHRGVAGWQAATATRPNDEVASPRPRAFVGQPDAGSARPQDHRSTERRHPLVGRRRRVLGTRVTMDAVLPHTGRRDTGVGPLSRTARTAGVGTAEPVARGGRLWAWPLVANRRSCVRCLVVRCCAGRDAPDQGDLIATRPTCAGPQIRTAEKYCSEVQEWRDRVPHNGCACAQSPSRGAGSGILQAGG